MTSTVRLRDVGSTYGGLTGKTKVDFGRGDASFVTFLEVINSTRLRGRDLERVRVAKGERQSRVMRGDLLFNGSSETPEEVALSAVVDFEPEASTFLNSFCFGFRLRSDAAVDPTYLAYFFRSAAGRSLVASLAQGATRYNIAKTKFLDVELALPSVEQQREIVESLGDADDLIAALERMIAKKQAIKQGMMQQLLTGRTRLPGFTGRWDEVALGESGVITGGGVDKTSNPGESAVMLLNYVDVYRAEFIDQGTARMQATASAAKLAKCSVKARDVFFTPTSETPDDIARSAVADADLPGVVYSYHLVRWRPGAGWDPSYLGYAFSTERFRAQASTFAAGSGTRYVVSMPGFRSLVVPKPPIDEQRAIGATLREVSNEINVLNARLRKAQAVKTGMMQELLTGRTRLPSFDSIDA